MTSVMSRTKRARPGSPTAQGNAVSLSLARWPPNTGHWRTEAALPVQGPVHPLSSPLPGVVSPVPQASELHPQHPSVQLNPAVVLTGCTLCVPRVPHGSPPAPMSSPPHGMTQPAQPRGLYPGCVPSYPRLLRGLLPQELTQPLSGALARPCIHPAPCCSLSAPQGTQHTGRPGQGHSCCLRPLQENSAPPVRRGLCRRDHLLGASGRSRSTTH